MKGNLDGLFQGVDEARDTAAGLDWQMKSLEELIRWMGNRTWLGSRQNTSRRGPRAAMVEARVWIYGRVAAIKAQVELVHQTRSRYGDRYSSSSREHSPKTYLMVSQNRWCRAGYVWQVIPHCLGFSLSLLNSALAIPAALLQFPHLCQQLLDFLATSRLLFLLQLPNLFELI